jgi:hypothetical protein
VKKRTKVFRVVVAAFLGLCAFSIWFTLRETHGVGVSSLWWLPPEAHNITYIRNDLYALAEFDIDREAFGKWCASRKMPLRKLGAGEHPMVGRPLWMLEKRGILPPTAEPNKVEEALSGMDRFNKSFGAGDLFYEDRWPNGGGYSIGYDVEEKRGYYKYSHH